MERFFLEILSAILLLRIRVCCSAHCCISAAQHGAVFLSVLMRFLVLGQFISGSTALLPFRKKKSHFVSTISGVGIDPRSLARQPRILTITLGPLQFVQLPVDHFNICMSCDSSLRPTSQKFSLLEPAASFSKHEKKVS